MAIFVRSTEYGALTSYLMLQFPLPNNGNVQIITGALGPMLLDVWYRVRCMARHGHYLMNVVPRSKDQDPKMLH